VCADDSRIAEETQRGLARLDLVHPGRTVLRDLFVEMEAQL
jgi:hypothetical protein